MGGGPMGRRAGPRLSVSVMTVIGVPWHLDEYLPGLDVPLAADTVIRPDLPPGDVWGRLAALYSRLADAVAGTAGLGARPVVVSGDCPTALGIMAGLQRAGIDAGIVWLDAHGDLQTLETTTSGYLGGLPLRLLAGYRPELIARRLGLRAVPEDQITLAGARDLDPPEAAYLAGARIRQVQVEELDTGDRPAGDRPGGDLPAGPLYLHVDLDVVDSAQLPGLRYPAPGGPGPAQVAGALRAVLGTGRVAAVGIACTWYPGHSAADRIRPYLAALA